jgi:hypothetical protein
MTKHINPYFEVPNFDELINKLEKLRVKIDTELEKLVSILQPQANWNVRNSNDVRATTFAHLGMLVDSTNLSLTFINKHLLPLTNSWWKEKHKPPFEGFNDSDKAKTVNAFNNYFIKFAFLHYLFSEIESAFRILLRHLNPVVADNARAFNRVYKGLKSEIVPTLDNSDELIDLLRESRNTIHNNSAYFNLNSSNDRQIIYKGRTYDFIHGKAINFVNWEWLLEMLDDVLDLHIKVIYDPRIIGVTSEISNP